MVAPQGRTWRSPCTIARWARHHLALWIVAAGAINAALVALVAVLIALPGQSGRTISSLIAAFILLLLLSVVFPVAGRVIDERDSAAEQERKWRKHGDQLLVRGSAKHLPRLSDLTNDVLGVTPTRYSIEGRAPYVARPEADEKIRSLLATPGPPYPFVIMWGTTKAGKSRTLVEALRATFTYDPVVVVPRDGEALATFVRLETGHLLDHQPAVVMLDDLDPAGLEMLTPNVLAEIRGWAVIAATMTAQKRANVLVTRGGVGVVARAALASRSGEYELSSEPPTGVEKDEAERLYPAEVFDGSIAETLVGARELIARYKASYDTNPAGCAVVRAAVDVRRAGLLRPVSDSVLRRLFPSYLRSVRTGLVPTDEQFAAGVEWAARPVTSQVALLRLASLPGEPNAWAVFDHAVTADEGQDGPQRPIPAETWAELIEMLPVGDVLGVAFTAQIAGNQASAVTALRKAVASGVLTQIPELAMAAGMMLRRHGDWQSAQVALRQAIDYGDVDVVPLSRVSLGNILEEQGDIDGARTAYQQAVDSANAEVLPVALISLGNLFGQLGELNGARTAYQRVIDSGHADLAPIAAARLKELPKQHDEMSGSDHPRA